MSVSALPVRNNDNWQKRVDLAAAFQWTARLNMHEAVANHFSLVLDDKNERFLINPNQRHFSRIKASDLLELDIAEMENVSKRWEYDMQSDSWMSKNTRPLTLIYLTVCMTLFIVFDSLDLLFDMKNVWIELLKTLLVTVYVAYFGSRGAEKVFITKNKN